MEKYWLYEYNIHIHILDAFNFLGAIKNPFFIAEHLIEINKYICEQMIWKHEMNAVNKLVKYSCDSPTM